MIEETNRSGEELRSRWEASLCERNRNRDFTIISQNCMGGLIYHDLGLQFKTPTIDLVIRGENFIRLVENLQEVLSVPAVPGRERIPGENPYPTIRASDVEVCGFHYPTCAEACEAWNRRRERVNLNNVFVIANAWDMDDDPALMEKLVRASDYKTIVFSDKEYSFPGCFHLPGGFWKRDAEGLLHPNPMDFIPGSYKRYFEEFFDFVDWLNHGSGF